MHNSQQRPSMTILRKVMQILTERSLVGRTDLALAANVHYSRLVDQLTWLERKRYVKATINEGKVVYGLTTEGSVFASKLLSLEE